MLFNEIAPYIKILAFMGCKAEKYLKYLKR